VLSAPIGQIEGYRSHRLIPVLTHDVDTISDFSFAFTPLAIAATVTLGCLGYLAYLSVPMFLMMVVAIVIGSAVQFIAGGRASRASTWRATMRMSCSVTTTPSPAAPRNCACTGPAFRMNTQRIQATADRIADIQVRSVNIYILAKTFGSMLFFVVIGLALAMQAYHPNPDPSVITGFVLVLLYMKGPLEHLLGYLPVVGKARSHLPDQ
jgi:putative ATP-binding cassette transporter